MFELIVNIITLPIMLVGLLTLGTFEVIYSGDRVATKEKRFESIVSKSLELRADAFLVHLSEDWSLEKVGECSTFPASVEDYERDPENWMNTDAYAQQGKGLKDGFGKIKITGVVKAGTKLTITKILLRKSIINGNYYKIYAKINDGAFAGRTAEVKSMFVYFTSSGEDTPKIDESVIAFVRS